MSEAIISVRDLKIHYPIKLKQKGQLLAQKGIVAAVDGMSFDILRGEALGIVGESGCGKSTTGRAIVHLEKPTSGEIWYQGKDIWTFSNEELFEYRKKAQMIFQDAYSTLDPRFTIGRSICEPMVIHRMGDDASRKQKALELMDQVGLPASYYDRYPHEFSGGQRQRIGIARALTLNPEILVCDEPVSALDVSIQAQVLNQMMDLQMQFHLTYVFVSHNLSVVKHFCDRIAVIYLGNLVELATKEELFTNMMHPYTQALIAAIPIPDPKYRNEKPILEGDVPTPINPPKGCPFVTRCAYAADLCAKERPHASDIGSGHCVACHAYGERKEEYLAERRAEGGKEPEPARFQS